MILLSIINNEYYVIFFHRDLLKPINVEVDLNQFVLDVTLVSFSNLQRMHSQS